ncbi:MAG: capsular polysaccharide biosynthesis protein [Deltaproteobacteria bacterium]|nr:capsular polysaccharide biosynthesis protein [Deltaproteobacteria bacterium]
MLGAERVVVRPVRRPADLDAVVGWGEKRNTQLARAWAEVFDVPYWRVEDGFVRSVGLGVTGDPPLSIVLDDLGIYYDARRWSRLERIIVAGEGLDDLGLLTRAKAAIARIVAAGLSKYNAAPPGEVDLGPPRKRVLVIDQTFGDLAIECGLADASSFERMLAAARAEHPDAEILVKTHPDVLAGKKRGYLETAAGHNVRLWATNTTPAALLAHVEHVYVVSSQLGFEALLAGKPVTTFGMPWYAGWGLTEDRATGDAAKAAFARRGVKRTKEQLVAAAYFRYARYVDPDTGEPCELERVIEHLELQRAMFANNTGKIFCFGFRFWKQSYVRAYLRSPGNEIVFASDAAAATRRGFGAGCHALVWGQRETADVRDLAARHGVDVWRMEDGFLRSVGLGSDLVEPASLVVDRAGIYYDPSKPSELEEILMNATFSDAELARAKALRELIVATRISKYNVGGDRALSVPAGQRVILCPGQVEDDASIKLGCKDVRTNLGLLEAARQAAPDAFIIFKPHPDVLSGNRIGAVDPAAARALCDHIEEDATLAACLDAADEVHTMTSLVGFEGLIRGKRVVVHGQPFYGGWGLTEDHNPHPRRTRKRTLDELCAATLLRYPRYLNRATGRFTTPEVVIDQLRAERNAAGDERTIKLAWSRRQARKLVQIVRGVRG